MNLCALHIAGEVAANAIGALFFSSGLMKIRDLPGFASVVASYRLLPLDAAFPTARILCLGQILLGLWLFSGQYPRSACYVAAMLLALFSWAMGVNVIRGRTNLNCGCLPGRDTLLSPVSVARTVLLSLLALYSGLTVRPQGLILSVTLLLCGSSLLMLILAFLQLRSAGESS